MKNSSSDALVLLKNEVRSCEGEFRFLHRHLYGTIPRKEFEVKSITIYEKIELLHKLIKKYEKITKIREDQ